MRRPEFPAAYQVDSRSLVFDKYDFYQRAVQSPDVDAKFLDRLYFELRGDHATVLREDFCGTFLVACEWVKRSKLKQAVALGLDVEPLGYGIKFNRSTLNSDQQKRLQVLSRDVLSHRTPGADLIVALNFSFFSFRERRVLKRYFESVYKSLSAKGVFVCDLFGGPACQRPNVDRSRRSGFEYFWEQKNYNPINQHARFEIHFKPRNGRKVKNVFHYEWRMWNLPEVQDILREVGFRETHVYWESDSRKGSGGSGIFRKRQIGDAAESWVAYVAALK